MSQNAQNIFLNLITDDTKIQKLSGYEPSKVNKLLHLNRGPEGANMLTHGLYRLVHHNKSYLFQETGLTPTEDTANHAIDLEHQAHHPIKTTTPPFLEITVDWDATPFFSGDNNNILGDNGRLYIDEPLITIPCVKASQAELAFYGAILINPGDIICFPDPTYPIWSMTIQESYVTNFLMTEQGGGFYLEYHQDQPHYHHAINGSGYYLLAKWNENKSKLLMTGFQIPNGHAVYTMKNSIHCDAGLIGDYLVGYTTSEKCSTVLLRSQNEKLVEIDFHSL